MSLSTIRSAHAPLTVHFWPLRQSTSAAHWVRQVKSPPQTIGHTAADGSAQNLVQSLLRTQPCFVLSGARQAFPMSLFTQSSLFGQSFDSMHWDTQNPSAQTRFPEHWLARTHLGVGFAPPPPPQP